MDIMDKIELLQDQKLKMNFTDYLDLTEYQRKFVDLESEESVVYYEDLSERCSGRTYSMLLRAIKIGLDLDNRYSIGIFSRTIESSKITQNKFECILEDNNLMEYVRRISRSEIVFNNGTVFKFTVSNDQSRGMMLDYAFVDDWVKYYRQSRYIEDCIIASTLKSKNGQVFFMCTN